MKDTLPYNNYIKLKYLYSIHIINTPYSNQHIQITVKYVLYIYIYICIKYM